MPKLKTHKATVKRIRASKNGKFLRSKAAKSHLLTHKSRRSKAPIVLNKADYKRVRRLAPYL